MSLWAVSDASSFASDCFAVGLVIAVRAPGSGLSFMSSPSRHAASFREISQIVENAPNE